MSPSCGGAASGTRSASLSEQLFLPQLSSPAKTSQAHSRSCKKISEEIAASPPVLLSISPAPLPIPPPAASPPPGPPPGTAVTPGALNTFSPTKRRDQPTLCSTERATQGLSVLPYRPVRCSLPSPSRGPLEKSLHLLICREPRRSPTPPGRPLPLSRGSASAEGLSSVCLLGLLLPGLRGRSRMTALKSALLEATRGS